MSVDAGEPKAPPALRLRTRIWAFLISLYVPGLGQAFLGRYRRGAAFTMAIVLALLVVKLSVFLWPAWRGAALPIIVLAAASGLATLLCAAIDSWRLGRRAAVPRFAWPKRYLTYVALIVAWYVPNAVGFMLPQWRPFSMPSVSMLPALQPGDYFFVLAGYFDTHEPQRGDLVVFKLPCQYPQLDRAEAAVYARRCTNTTEFIKRIVGLPGDKIQMRRGVVTINGQPALREGLPPYPFSEDGRTTAYRQYVETLSDGHRTNILEIDDNQPLDNTDAFTVPANSYFMMGDNRDDSADSRDPTSGVGFVPRDHLVGKAAVVYFSTGGGAAIRWERIGMPLS